MKGGKVARVETVPIESLQPDPNNANRHTQKGMKLVNNSIRRRGLFRGIAAAGKGTETPVVYAGNLTLEQAVEAGITEAVIVHTTGNQLVVTVRDDVAPGSAEAVALGLEDNESGKQSYNPDIDLVAAMAAGDDAILSALKKEDKVFGSMLEGMGVKDEIQDAGPQFDRAAELLEKWGVKTGDLWRIGEHRLLCGDSTKREDVERVMGGEKAELLFTSPPYSDMRTYEGDKDLSIEKLIEFIPAFREHTSYQVINLGVQRKEAEVVQYWDAYISKAKECGYKFLSWNVWNKEQATSIGMQTAIFPIFHEWLLVFGFEAKEINRTLPKSEGSYERQKYTKPGTRRNKDGELNVASKGDMSFNFVKMGTVTTLRAANTIGDSIHPAMFPVYLPEEYIKAMTSEGDYIAEPFAGSGTTMVACQNLGRKCRAIEISPAYCAVTLERMSVAFPGIEIQRVNSGE